MIQQHEHVKKPSDLLKASTAAKKNQTNKFIYRNEMFLQWVTDHILASVILFDVALVVPLIVIPAPDSVKITLGVISGSWIQWWALPALQRSQNKTQAQNDAKAEADHETLTYLANLQDRQMRELESISEAIGRISKTNS